jgi:uracil-DNA glycosylase
MGAQQSFPDLLPMAWRQEMKESYPLLTEIEAKLSGRATNPSREKIFTAFNVDPGSIKVIILGQDPYPDPLAAMGLAFSTPTDCKKIPASLRNIFTEYHSDLGLPIPVTGDLTPWVKEGVFLLNTILTCAPGESLSHSDLGWELFTEAVLEKVVTPKTVGILWGTRAQKYSSLFDGQMVIASVHPSPLSAYRGFFGSRPFSRANELLDKSGIEPINWTLQNA